MEKLLELLYNLHDDIDFRRADRLLTDHLLDSFDLVNLILSIQQTFGVRIPASAIRPEHFDRAEDIYTLIQSLQGRDRSS